MPIEPDLFRQVMRQYPTGVAVLTARADEAIHGMTANSFSSVSLTPPLALVCILRGSTTHHFVTHGGNFALNVLSGAQIGLAQRFAKQVPLPPEPFADIPNHPAATGAPIFDHCIAYVDCRVVAAYEAGTHTIFVGMVEAAGYGSLRDAAPLLWHHREYLEMQKSLGKANWDADKRGKTG